MHHYGHNNDIIICNNDIIICNNNIGTKQHVPKSTTYPSLLEKGLPGSLLRFESNGTAISDSSEQRL